MSEVVIDGVRLDVPQALTSEDVSELARFNSELSRGRAFDPETLARMAQLQLRFDWLGYFTEDGESHAGNRAYPPIVFRTSKRRRWWQR